MTPLDTALGYAARGWPVCSVRLWNGKKQPLIEDWGNAASTDPAQITAWWRRWPKALIGVPTGRRSGFVVLDVDVKEPEAYGFDTLADLGGAILPVTPMAHTRSDGLHVYFACIDIEIRNSVGKHGLGPGLDVRGQGGLIVVPCPGSGYRWDPHYNFDTVPLHPAPAWLGHRQKHSRSAIHNSPRQRFDPAVILAECCDRIRNAADGDKYFTVRRESFIAATLVRDRRVSDHHARHELRAALLSLERRAKDPNHMMAAYEGAFAEGLAAPPRRTRA
jgi:putative DNA primase/helicase